MRTATMIAERRARDGELCTCGRPARFVYETPEGDVPYCLGDHVPDDGVGPR